MASPYTVDILCTIAFGRKSSLIHLRLVPMEDSIDKPTISMKFLSPLPLYDREKPFNIKEIREDIPPSDRTNMELECQKNIALVDLRLQCSKNTEYELHGFKYVLHPESCLYDLNLDQVALARYCESMMAFAYEEFCADNVICYDVRVSCRLCSCMYLTVWRLTRISYAAVRLLKRST